MRSSGKEKRREHRHAVSSVSFCLSLHIFQRIHQGSPFDYFKVQMRSVAVTGIPHIGDVLTLSHPLADFDRELAAMGVPGFKAVAMIDQNVIPIAVMPSGFHDFAAVGGDDRLSEHPAVGIIEGAVRGTPAAAEIGTDLFGGRKGPDKGSRGLAISGD